MIEPNSSEAQPKKTVRRVTRVRSSASSEDTKNSRASLVNNLSPEEEGASPHDLPAELPRAPRLIAPADRRNSSDSSHRDGLQVVYTLEEGNTLVKRLRQLEGESASLANALSKVCDDNAKLATHVVQKEEKCVALAQSPLASTSVLRSLFEPEKSGWFGGSKNAARENLERMTEELQNEFLAYQASHASSNDEVQALIGELQSAHMNAHKLSLIVHEQQEVISRGPLAVTVRIVSSETDAERVSIADLRNELDRRHEREGELRQEIRDLHEKLRVKTIEISRQKQELQERGLGGGNHCNEVEYQYMNDEIARLKTEVSQLQKALAAEEQLHKLKVKENNSLSQRLAAMEERLRAATTEEHTQPAAHASSSVATEPCPECARMREECDVANERLRTVTRNMQQLESRLSELKQANEEMNELRKEKDELEQKLYHSVPRDTLVTAEMENKRLLGDLNFTTSRVKHLEEVISREREKNSAAADKRGDTTEGKTEAERTLDEEEILDVLQRNKDRISHLEFQRNQLFEEAKQLREVAVAKEEEMFRLTRASQEDKQRINFLLKRCVTLTADLKSLAAAKDALSEEHETAQLELKKLRRDGEEMVKLQQDITEVKRENNALQDRLSSVEELENRLVRAKETIAYMELAQSRSINLSQYAELQSKTSKLENTLGPIKKQLEESKKELARIKDENESLHAVLTRQQNTIKTHEEQTASLQANDAKMREKMNHLTSENERLQGVNETLEAQMTNMQDGIKEMAVKLEQERSRAQINAEATYKEEITQLRLKLDSANATLASVRSTQNSFVPEGIHKATLEEKERVSEELRQKTFDLDKLKSEILIYRQTIDDLETENEEHVRQIESLQELHAKERGAAAERLAIEVRKVTEVNEELEGMRSRVTELQKREEQLIAKQKEMEEMAQKHRRAFEDKCRQEEKLLQTIAAANGELEEQREELMRTKNTALEYKDKHQKLESEIASVSAEGLRRQQEVEDECGKLREEIRSLDAEKSSMELELKKLREAVNTISDRNNNNNSISNTSGKNICDSGGGGNDDIVSLAPHPPSPPAAAETTTPASMMTMRRLSSDSDSNDHVSADGGGLSPGAALQYARAEQLHMSLIQAQSQLEEQKKLSVEAAETFGNALDKADAEAAALRERVQELESELHKMTQHTADSLSVASSRQRKKKGAVKKDLTSIAQLNDLQGTDVLAIAAATEGVRQQQQQQLQQQRETIETMKQELKILQDENARLKKNATSLTQALLDAQKEVEIAMKDVDSQTSEFRHRIKVLESQLQHKKMGTTESSAELHRLVEEDKRLEAELEKLSTDSANVILGKPDMSENQLKAELQIVARELVLTKSKLIEYMAMADRLGVQYPFSAEMEGTAVLRLKALHFDSATGRVRACSAPRHRYADSVDKESRGTSSKKKKKTKKRQKVESQDDEFLCLR